MSSGTRSVTLEGEPIEYTVRESGEATQPRIDVGIQQVSVVVSENEAVDPETLLREKTEWVLEKKAKYDTYRNQAPDRVFEEGETFPYRGTNYEVIIESRPASEAEDGAIKLAAHHVEQTSIEQALRQFYRRKAREYIEQVAEQYAEEMDVEYDALEIRNQRTKWGSCSSSGTLGINLRLIMAPSEILEYVVIHELAHLKEDNHTKVFWSIVEEFDPD
jgi:predicted metal-dependent hydrolase